MACPSPHSLEVVEPSLTRPSDSNLFVLPVPNPSFYGGCMLGWSLGVFPKPATQLQNRSALARPSKCSMPLGQGERRLLV